MLPYLALLSPSESDEFGAGVLLAGELQSVEANLEAASSLVDFGVAKSALKNK